MERETLENLLKKTKENDLCRYYKCYDVDVQQMVENLYKATYRMGLYGGQIIYILNEALQPFKKEKKIFNLR